MVNSYRVVVRAIKTVMIIDPCRSTISESWEKNMGKRRRMKGREMKE